MFVRKRTTWERVLRAPDAISMARTAAVTNDTRADSEALPHAPTEAAASASPGQKAKKRIQDAANAVEAERRSSPTSLQDTFMDERNDVLAVINELEDHARSPT